MEELHLPLEETKLWIHDLYLFLHSHQDIMSAHSVDFFTYDHWNTIIKSSWKEDLLAISCDEQFLQPPKGALPGKACSFASTHINT